MGLGSDQTNRTADASRTTIADCVSHPRDIMARVARAVRLDPVGGWHHVMSRGVNRAPIFVTVDDRLDFGRLLGQVTARFGIEIHAYCLMGNHFHLLVRCPSGGVSAAMHLLLSSFARMVNDRSGRVGHLFGDRFCSRLVTDWVYLANVVRYIHLNPVDIASCADIGDYRWSSHRTYLGLRPCPEWLHLDTVLGWFDGPAAFDAHVRSNTRRLTKLTHAESAELVSAVDLLLAERSDASPRHFPALRRAALIALMPSLSAETRLVLMASLGIETEGALRTAVSRARTLLRNESIVEDVLERMQQLFASTPTAAAVCSR